MGGAPNYSKGRQEMRRMSDGKARAFAQNIIIKDGRGRYPKCLEILPYQWCPKKEEVPSDPKNLLQNCKTCLEFTQSKFYIEHFAHKAMEERIKRLHEMGLPTRIEG